MGYIGEDRSSNDGRVGMNSVLTIDRTGILGIGTKIFYTLTVIIELIVYVV